MTLSESTHSQRDFTNEVVQGQRIQFSLGGLMMLMALVAVAVTVGRWFIEWLDHPINFLLACALGSFVGTAIVITRNHVPHTRLLNVMLVLFVIINWGWFPGGNAGYLVGLICGVLLAWRGEVLANLLLCLCGFRLSRPHVRKQQDAAEEGDAE